MQGEEDESEGMEWGRKVEDQEKVEDDIEKNNKERNERRKKQQQVKRGKRCRSKKYDTHRI